MEVPQGYSLGIFTLNKQKCHFFFISFIKSENRGVEQAQPERRGLILVEGGRRWGKSIRG
jgi:hypothetical protein